MFSQNKSNAGDVISHVHATTNKTESEMKPPTDQTAHQEHTFIQPETSFKKIYSFHES